MKIKLIKKHEMVIRKEDYNILKNHLIALVEYNTDKNNKLLQKEIDRVRQQCTGGEHDFVSRVIDYCPYSICTKCGMEK